VGTEDGTPVAVLRFTVVDGQITAIDALAGPARIAGLDLGGVLGR
jgi:RNA polymerase sigma-70 factor (ECF subfamily)